MPPIFSKEQKEEIRIQLLENGMKFIGQCGIRKMSVSMLATSVTIGKGTFYHFFPSKEDFVRELIYYEKRKIYAILENAKDADGMINRDAFMCMMPAMFDSENNALLYHLKPDDELWIAQNLSQDFGPNSDRKKMILTQILDCCDGCQKDLNLHVIENLTTILALTIEERTLFNQDALNETLKMIVKSLADYIFGE